jgi:hypothetical protein
MKFDLKRQKKTKKLHDFYFIPNTTQETHHHQYHLEIFAFIPYGDTLLNTKDGAE